VRQNIFLPQCGKQFRGLLQAVKVPQRCSTYYQKVFGPNYRKAAEYLKKSLAADRLIASLLYLGFTGNVDEAIHQLNFVLWRERNPAVALPLLSQAYRLKALYPQSIETARQAAQATPRNAESHLWMADSLRLSGSYSEARTEYERYLQLSDLKVTWRANSITTCKDISPDSERESAQRSRCAT
jgi:hypothetical protein